MTTLLAELTRNGYVESVHHGTVVVSDAAGQIVASAGDPATFAYFRSSAKPFQAVPLITSGAADRFEFTPAELALCCASHHGDPHHQQQVATMLAKIGLGEEALRCGISEPIDDGEWARIATGQVKATQLQCDCSGKHAGVLATCVHLGEPLDTYLDPAHPSQVRILDVLAAAVRIPRADLIVGVDGCGLPAIGASIAEFARSYAVLANPAAATEPLLVQSRPALERLRRAMIAHPTNVSGQQSLVATLMTASNGALCVKSGAEGMICLAVPDAGYGIAIRVADGSFRAHPAIVCAVLRQLDLVPTSVTEAILDQFSPLITNHNRVPVGEVRAAFRLSA